MITTESQLAYYFDLHIMKQRQIWEELRQKLYQKYIDEGYWEGFAEEKATREMWELRSQPRRTHEKD